MNGGVVYRQRLKVKTPLINTYDKQMRFCEKRVKKISLAYPVNNWNFTPAHIASQDMAISKSPLYQTPASKKARRRSLEMSQSLRRKSSLYSRPQLLTPDVLKFKATLPHRGPSSLSQNDRHKMAHGVNPGSIVHHGEFHESHRKSKDPTNNTINNEQKGDHLNSFVTSTRPTDLDNSISYHHEYFIRALTTLAINNLTLNKTSSQERRASHNFYDRNIKALLDSPTWSENRNLPLPLVNAGLNTDDLSLESTSTSSSEKDEVTSFEPSNRERINRLRDYLKCSGLGEPIMVKVVNEETRESQKNVHRLVRRVHKGLSPERRERLRLKTHLEYEMSLMKAESFCEEQDQMWMRTASADMGDRDQQLLEEELKHQLLQGNKSENQLDISDSKQLANVNKYGRYCKAIIRKANRLDPTKNINVPSSDIPICDDEDGDYPLYLKAQDDEDTQVSRDNMSSTWRSPFSRREMRRRVFSWLKDVENAMGLEWKEKMRLTKRSK